MAVKIRLTRIVREATFYRIVAADTDFPGMESLGILGNYDPKKNQRKL